ncbi:MAG: DNA polymerase III subunit gamma/tau [Clostridia bacterium]|nr:DNA polymerase III subunit gamma/tau [Clostridia bacterium]
MHQALYRKWRPRSFDEVQGQEHITSILKYEVANNKFSHAYLFCGSRGTGKTSCAKILAKAVNCLDSKDGNPCGKCEACLAIDSGAATDVLEMDAASNNGVDNIRDIRDEVVYSPSNLKYRVYIIDEVHMLSTSAFNALLKTLEEPPEHVVFILATTELHKLPATIISRCQRFDFRRITTEVLGNHLLRIAKAEGIELEDSAAVLLAKQAQGGMRDAISLLDLCAGSRERIDEELVNLTVGKIGRENMLAVVEAIAQKDYETIFAAVDETVRSSRDITVFWQDLISVYRDLLVVKTSSNATRYLDLTDSETQALTSLAALFTTERLSYHCGMLQDALLAMQKANAVRRITAELTLVRMCDERLSSSPEAMLARISNIESNIATGNFTAQTTAPQAQTEAEQAPKKPRRAQAPVPSDDDDSMFRGDAPGMTVSAPKKEAAPTTPTARISTPRQVPEPTGSVRTLKPFRNRAEVLEKMEGASAMQASFFKRAKWYTDEGGKIVLKFENQFDLSNMTFFDGEAFFLKIASSVLGRALTKADLGCECDTEKKTDSVIDKILEAAEE